MDDIAKIDFGESNLSLSSSMRGKKMIVPATNTLGKLNHDVKSLMHSVCLKVKLKIPEEYGTFYGGYVSATLVSVILVEGNCVMVAV